MTKEKYIRKVKQITSIIESIKVDYEDWRNGVYTSTTPGHTESEEAAKKILSKLGINEPSK